MNQGLLLISPMLLTRLLSVEEFGQYREFLLYATVLDVIAAYNISTSLLRFVAHQPEHRQQFVDQALLMTLGTSSLVVGVYRRSQLDFRRRAGRQLHAAARHIHIRLCELRLLGVHVAGATARRRGVRLYDRPPDHAHRDGRDRSCPHFRRAGDHLVAGRPGIRTVRRVAVHVAALPPCAERRLESGWREQLRFCGPAGAASVLIGWNKSMGSLFVAKFLGPVGLAHYAIGTYMRPIITVLRNSLSDALLPEMSTQQRSGQPADSLVLWRRVTIVTAIMLIPAAVLLTRFADTIVVTLFSQEYQPAVPVFQIFLLVLFREIVDFAVPLRAINRTAPIMYSNLVSIVVNAILLAILLPTVGLLGAAIAYVISRVIEGVYLGRQTARPTRSARASWSSGATSARSRSPPRWPRSRWSARSGPTTMGLFGVVAAGCCFMVVYVPLLLLLRLPEALLLRDRVQLIVGRALARLKRQNEF